MFDKVITYFKNQGWKYTIAVEGSAIAFLGISGANGNFEFVVQVDENEEKIIFFSIYGSYIPKEKRHLVAELLSRLNYGQFLGNFELNFEDGEIRYRTGMLYQDLDISQAIIDQLVMTNIISMDIALPSISQLVNKNISPQEAYLLAQEE